MLIDELMECERAILLWEKKIQLEKETTDTIDPELGTSELGLMKKNLCTMNERLNSIKKQQQLLVSEMEYNIKKYDVHSNVKLISSTNTTQNTIKQIQQQIQSIQSQINKNMKSNRTIQNDIKQIESELITKQHEYESLHRIKLQYDNTVIELQQQQMKSAMDKNMLLDDTIAIQKFVKYCDNIWSDKKKYNLIPSSDKLMIDSNKIESKFNELTSAINDIKLQYPQHQNYLDQLLVYCA